MCTKEQYDAMSDEEKIQALLTRLRKARKMGMTWKEVGPSLATAPVAWQKWAKKVIEGDLT